MIVHILFEQFVVDFDRALGVPDDQLALCIDKFTLSVEIVVFGWC